MNYQMLKKSLVSDWLRPCGMLQDKIEGMLQKKIVELMPQYVNKFTGYCDDIILYLM